MSENYSFPLSSSKAAYVAASPSEQKRITISGAGTVYYDDASSVTSSSNDGSIVTGASATFSTGQWLISASTSNVFISDAAPRETFEDVAVTDDLTVTDQITGADVTATDDLTAGDDLVVTDDATVTDDLLVSGTLTVSEDVNVTDDLDADAITATSVTVDGATGFVATANGGKDTLALSNTTADVGITIGADVNIYRADADQLKTDDALIVTGAIFALGNILHTPASDLNIYTTTSTQKVTLQANGGSVQVTKYSDNAVQFSVSDAGVVSIAPAAGSVGFYAVTPAARPSAYTQTYATATKTHSNPTAAAVATTGAALTAYGYAEAQANAIVASVNALVIDMVNVKSVLNSVIDDGQSLGLLQ